MHSPSACGKLILTGEHAVVYGQPALAIPVSSLRATCTVRTTTTEGIHVSAPDLPLREQLFAHTPLAALSPLGAAVHHTLNHLGGAWPDLEVEIRSSIPVARGMGSGAAVTAAIIRALAQAQNSPLPLPIQLALIHRVETLYHGTPSGIDGQVIGCERPLWFVRNQPPEYPIIQGPFHFLIADSGPSPPTREVVAGVRARYAQTPTDCQIQLEAIGALSHQARQALECGDAPGLGEVLNQNHTLLQALGVSSPGLDRITAAARQAGALGAKLSGAGLGGICISLVTPQTQAQVRYAVEQAGALAVWEVPLQSMEAPDGHYHP